ncbi:MAG: hypothetical protein HYU64_06010 [Armatimonadetes bacterium]|nr:hypothetical protein [Armatimonadota bacterium]
MYWRAYNLEEFTAEQALRDNIDWFSRLSPSRKIIAMEEHRRTIEYLRKLKEVPHDGD